jgi:hypothetical protein
VNESSNDKEREAEALPRATALLNKLDHIRRRKRAFGGQVVDVAELRRQIEAGRRSDAKGEQEHDD